MTEVEQKIDMIEMAEPMGRRVLLSRDVGDEMEGAVFIPGKSRKEFNSGTIMAVSDDLEQKIDVGDRVGYQKHAGIEFAMESDGVIATVILLAEEDITMVLKGNTRVGVVKKE